MADRVQERIVVRSGPDAVLEVLADFERYPEWQPEFREAEILETDQDGWGTRVRFVVDAKVLQARFTLAYTYPDGNLHWTLVEGDQLRRNDGSYDLTDLGDGTTEVVYSLEVEPSVPLPGMLRRQAAKRIASGALQGLQRRLDAV